MPSLSSEISKIVKESLHTYFSHLNGENPAVNFYQDILQSVEKPVIEETLAKVDFNQKKAAEILGMSRNTLSKKIQMLNITFQKKC